MIFISNFSLIHCAHSGYIYNVEHDKNISYLPAAMYYLVYKHTNGEIFVDFPKISEHFPKISQNSPKVVRRPFKRFRTFSENVRT